MSAGDLTDRKIFPNYRAKSEFAFGRLACNSFTINELDILSREGTKFALSGTETNVMEGVSLQNRTNASQKPELLSIHRSRSEVAPPQRDQTGIQVSR